MGGQIKDLTGKRFGKLVVKHLHEHVPGRVVWHCICDCGGTKNVKSEQLSKKQTRSCGCMPRGMATIRAKMAESSAGKLIVSDAKKTLKQSGVVPKTEKKWINDSNVPKANFATCPEKIDKYGRPVRQLTPWELGRKEAERYAYRYCHQWGIV